MKYKILVSDFDGTLARTDKTISQRTLHSIKNFISRGGIFCVCSGRMTKGIDHILIKHNLDNILLASFNGAEILDLSKNKLLFRKPIDNKTCIKFFKFCEQNKIFAQCYPKGEYVVSQQNERTLRYQTICGVETIIKNPISEFFKKSGLDSSKLLVFDDPSKINKYYPLLKEQFDNCNVVFSNSEQIDVNIKEVSKGLVCEYIAQKNGFTLDDVIAVGDAGNDISMLEKVGLPIAVENSSSDVKKYAKYIAKCNDEDPIEEIIDKFCI